jgi:hypothetical protein
MESAWLLHLQQNTPHTPTPSTWPEFVTTRLGSNLSKLTTPLNLNFIKFQIAPKLCKLSHGERFSEPIC